MRVIRIETWLTIGAMAAFSGYALADDGHRNGNDNNNNNNGNHSSLESSVIGSVPGMAIGGVNSGGAPWVVSEGEASVSSNGRVRVEVHGLLIGAGGPANLVGTTGPVTMVGASLICGGSGGTPVAVPNGGVTPVPLSSQGNAEIDQTVTLPASCAAPVVLVRIFSASAPLGSQLGAFIAVTGLTQTSDQNGHNNSGGYGH